MFVDIILIIGGIYNLLQSFLAKDDKRERRVLNFCLGIFLILLGSMWLIVDIIEK